MRHFSRFFASTAAFAAFYTPFAAIAAGPTVTDPVAVITNDSANGSNFATGLFIYFQAFNGQSISNQTAPTIITSPSFSSSAYGYVSTSTAAGGCGTSATCTSLFTKPEPTQPNQISASIPYSSTLTGPFSFHVSSTQNFAAGTNTLATTSGSLAGVGAVPFVGSFTITPGVNPLDPTVSWTAPSAQGIADAAALTPYSVPTINAARVFVIDNSTPIDRYNINPGAINAVKPFGSDFTQGAVVYNSQAITNSPTQTSFTFPTLNNNQNAANYNSPVLQYGHSYSIGVQLQYSVGPAVAGCGLCNVASRSDSFFDYTPIQPGSIPNLPIDAVINLPTTQPVKTTSGQYASPVYSFHVDSVSNTSVTFIDPELAYGFLYKVGAGDPNFASVNPITNLGAGIYQLLAWDGFSYILVDGSLHAGDTFDFLTNGFANGVSAFEIVGIDPGVDPTDITAFITGLTFTGPGSFTGTMTALVDSTTPLPPSWSLALTGFLGFGVLIFRRRDRNLAVTKAIAA